MAENTTERPTTSHNIGSAEVLDVRKLASDVLCEFLEVAFHGILYMRGIYPEGIFERRKKYNVPVQITRQPNVCQYIQDLISSMKPLLDEGKVERVCFVILDSSQHPTEKIVFDIGSSNQNADATETDKHLINLEQSLRALLLKLNTCDSLLRGCKPDCSWTVQVHTSGAAALDLQQNQQFEDFSWIEADTSQVKLTDPNLIPLKAVDSDILKMQLYLEEGSEKT